VLPGEAGGPGLSLPVQLETLRSQEIRVGDFAIVGASLEGELSADGFDIALQSDNVRGTFSQGAEGPLAVNLDTLVVPVDETPPDAAASDAEAQPAVPPGAIGRDPLTTAIIADLPVADVVVEHLMLGGGDYGRWSFGLRPEAGSLRVIDLVADVRGVRIDAPDGLTWDGERDVTRFVGDLTAGDLREVLPRWGYAPQLETAETFVGADFTWPGSPAAVDMLRLRGKATMRADNGRFLEMETAGGTLAVFSLLNFTAIAKRINLDFSDVSGKGISFDRLRARVALDRGLLTFVEPMEVEGTGSNFRIAGSVDLNTGKLDNEMIVTLPVSKSLPWYGAYIALANPIAGLGVLVGERVLRKPLEQFSSARYDIGGTLETPEVKLVSVFDTSMSDAPSAAGTAGDGTDQASDSGDASAAPAAEAEPAPDGQPEQTAATVTDE
jgi:uncharacterized protein YhdP